MASKLEWSAGFAKQAKVDFDTFQKLQSKEMANVPVCHKLQFLQMACEKLTKAHLYDKGSFDQADKKIHTVIRKHLPTILKNQALLLDWGEGKIREMLKTAKHLSQEIEYLSPTAIADGSRQDNCEYPWEDHGGVLQLPLNWPFTPLDLLAAPGARGILKLLIGAIDSLLT